MKSIFSKCFHDFLRILSNLKIRYKHFLEIIVSNSRLTKVSKKTDFRFQRTNEPPSWLANFGTYHAIRNKFRNTMGSKESFLNCYKRVTPAKTLFRNCFFSPVTSSIFFSQVYIKRERDVSRYHQVAKV